MRVLLDQQFLGGQPRARVEHGHGNFASPKLNFILESGMTSLDRVYPDSVNRQGQMRLNVSREARFPPPNFLMQNFKTSTYGSV